MNVHGPEGANGARNLLVNCLGHRIELLKQPYAKAASRVGPALLLALEHRPRSPRTEHRRCDGEERVGRVAVPVLVAAWQPASTEEAPVRPKGSAGGTGCGNSHAS